MSKLSWLKAVSRNLSVTDWLGIFAVIAIILYLAVPPVENAVNQQVFSVLEPIAGGFKYVLNPDLATK